MLSRSRGQGDEDRTIKISLSIVSPKEGSGSGQNYHLVGTTVLRLNHFSIDSSSLTVVFKSGMCTVYVCY